MSDSNLEGKKVLLLYAHFFGYDTIVKAKLESLGAKVDLYDARANITTFEKAVRKIYSKQYYSKQRKFHKTIQSENAKTKYDFIFSNDVLDEEILKQYRYVFPSSTMVLYLDDSVRNMKGVERTFKYYDRVLTFDKKDSEIYHIAFRPLFFSDIFQQDGSMACEEKYDISFIGTCHSDRLQIINKIRIKYPNLNCFFFCYLQSWFMYYYHFALHKEYRSVNKEFFQLKSMSMKEVADIMHQSKCILDIQHPAQTGLTMRTIETIGSKKKLITTNSEIYSYDFYDSNNILVIDRNNPIIDRSFLEDPAHELSESIMYRYSIAGWIEDIFQM